MIREAVGHRRVRALPVGGRMSGGLAIGLRSCAGGWRMICSMLRSYWCSVSQCFQLVVYVEMQSSRDRETRTLFLSCRCLAAQLLRLTRRLGVGLDSLWAVLLRIPVDVSKSVLHPLKLHNHIAMSVARNFPMIRIARGCGTRVDKVGGATQAGLCVSHLNFTFKPQIDTTAPLDGHTHMFPA